MFANKVWGKKVEEGGLLTTKALRGAFTRKRNIGKLSSKENTHFGEGTEKGCNTVGKTLL